MNGSCPSCADASFWRACLHVMRSVAIANAGDSRAIIATGQSVSVLAPQLPKRPLLCLAISSAVFRCRRSCCLVTCQLSRSNNLPVAGAACEQQQHLLLCVVLSLSARLTCDTRHRHRHTERDGQLVCTPLSDDQKPDRPDERKRIEQVSVQTHSCTL